MKTTIWTVGLSSHQPALTAFSSDSKDDILFGIMNSGWTFSIYHNGIEIPINDFKLKGHFKSAWNKLSWLYFMIKYQGKSDVFIVDGAWGVLGVFLKKLGLVKYFISLHFDYYGTHNKLIDWCCHFSAKYSDECWKVSNRIPYSGKINKLYYTGIPDRNFQITKSNGKSILFMGSNINTQCFWRLVNLAFQYNIPIEIIGNVFNGKKQQFMGIPTITIHGFVSDDEMKSIASKCFASWAVYENDTNKNWQWYGEPAKYKQSLSLGLPILLNPFTEVAPELLKQKIAMDIDDFNGEESIKLLYKYKNNIPNFIKYEQLKIKKIMNRRRIEIENKIDKECLFIEPNLAKEAIQSITFKEWLIFMFGTIILISGLCLGLYSMYIIVYQILYGVVLYDFFS